MKTLLRANTVAILAAMAREYPNAQVEIEINDPDPMPLLGYHEVSEYPKGGKVRNGGKRKWKGRDKVKAARKQRRSQK